MQSSLIRVRILAELFFLSEKEFLFYFKVSVVELNLFSFFLPNIFIYTRDVENESLLNDY